MNAGGRLFAFGAGLVVLAAASFGIGSALDASAPGSGEGAGHMEAVGARTTQTHGEDGGHGGGQADEHGGSGGHGAMQMDAVRGLGVSENGMRLEVVDPEWSQGETAPLSFRIVDEQGAPLTEFDLTHTKRMHVIVVRRDLTGFQHLHPQMAADGTWSVPLRLDQAGTYRVFADFSRGGEATTLADDLRVDGGADLRALPSPASDALSKPGGYTVALSSGDGGHSGAHAGEEAGLRFAISRDGQPASLQPYLGAGGHLVALREGDLAFLHVHPTGDGGKDGSIEFEATFPTAGRYRLFLQFKVAGELQTVAFTEEVH